MHIFVLTLVDDSGDSFTDYENRCPTDKAVHYCQDRDTAERFIDDWHNEIRRSDEYKRFLRLELPTNDDPEPFTTYCDTYGIRESIEEVAVVNDQPEVRLENFHKHSGAFVETSLQDDKDTARHLERLDDCNPDIALYGRSAVLTSLYIFLHCGAPYDWCMQSSQGDLVFGGSNRVFLKPTGWVASKSHCSREFIAAFIENGFGSVQ